MKKRVVCFLMIGTMVLSLCGCGMNINVKGGNPWINSEIEENVKDNYDTELKDDFNLAVNKDWTLNNPVKDGELSNDFLSSFDDELNDRLLGIINDDSYVDNYDAQLVTTYYNAFLDWDARNALGVEPLKPYLEAINNIDSYEDLLNYSNSEYSFFSDATAWTFSVSPEDATLKIIGVGAPEIFLNDKADYQNINKMDSYTKLVYNEKKDMVKAVLSRCGYSDKEIDSIYEGAIEFEKFFSQYCYTNDELYLTETMMEMNEMLYTEEEFAAISGSELFTENFAYWGITDIPQIQFFEKSDYFENLNVIYNDDNIEIIKDYLIAHTAANCIGKLDEELYYTALDIINEMNDITGYLPEEEIALRRVSSDLGWPLSKLYCEKYVTEDDRQIIYNLISDIIDEYKVMISEEEFLSEETKANAIYKLENMEIKCMYPDDWYDYSNLDLSGSYMDMYCAISNYEGLKAISEFNQPVDRSQWDITPITVNAFYNAADNSINILPGLIGDVLYNDDMALEEVYGMVGAVIGHEISHGFDPDGALYDEIGNYNSWWTDEDYEAFDELTQRLVDYYDGITIWKDLNCNGELVKGEACADMAAVACLLRLAAKEDDFDYDLFFRSYARVWAGNTLPYYDYSSAMYDSHPLNYLRTNVVVAQFDEFYETYDIKEGDGMYIAPEDRIKIW